MSDHKVSNRSLSLKVNVIGLMRVTREAVASMKDKKTSEGHIINVSRSARDILLDC